MPLVKMLVQSVISDYRKWLTIDMKDYNLNTPLPRLEYLPMFTKFITPEIIIKYSLQNYFDNNSVLFQVNKSTYGLPQAGLLAQ